MSSQLRIQAFSTEIRSRSGVISLLATRWSHTPAFFNFRVTVENEEKNQASLAILSLTFNLFDLLS